MQEPVEPHVIDKGMPTAGLVAHTTVSRFVDHIPHKWGQIPFNLSQP